MKKFILIGVVTIFLSSCANDANIYGGIFGQRVVGNKNYVTISNVWNEMDALPLAEKHCSKFNRSARFNKMEGPQKFNSERW